MTNVVDVTVGDKQIGTTVEIAIDKLRAKPKLEATGSEQTGLAADVGEHSLLKLTVQPAPLAVVIRQHHIQPPVTVNVLNRDGHSRAGQTVTCDRQACQPRPVHEPGEASGRRRLIDEPEIWHSVVGD